MTSSTQFLAGNLRITLGLADALARDIPADKFAFKPHPTINHPAWCFGHLSLYPDRAFNSILGRTDLARTNERFTKLFEPGSKCLDDASIYPAKDEIMAELRERHAVMLDYLETVDDEVLQRPTAHERYASRFPQIGHVLHFLFANHVTMHLGQVSSWRRCIGLPSAM
ncbi:MAG: DinB family protein [Phycisphaerales bacterium]|nr:DinB family protein [Phycisphaerales bacterium]